MASTHRIDNERGRIGKSIDQGVDGNGKPWVNFSLASDVNRRNEHGEWDQVGTTWRQVHAHGAKAKNFADTFQPGDPVVVSGDVEVEARVVSSDEGPRIEQRENVNADMVAPDMNFMAVQLPPRRPRESQGPTAQAGPAGPAAGQQVPGGDQSAPSPLQSAAYAEPTAGGGDGWPPVAQAGQASAPTPF